MSKTREVSAFDSVKVSGGFVVKMIGAGKQAVSVKTDENLQQYISTQVKNHVLMVSVKKGISLRGNDAPIIKIDAVNLTQLDLSGSVKLDAKNLRGNRFILKTSGSSEASLAGNINHFTLDISGAGNVNAQYLKANGVAVNILRRGHSISACKSRA